MVFDIVKELARNLNFTFTVEVIKLDNQHSLNNKSEKYDSTDITNVVTNSIPEIAVDLVRSKAVALAACAFTITEQDKLYLNFTSPVSTQTYTFLVSRPRELSRALLFMSPFTKDVSLLLVKDRWNQNNIIFSDLALSGYLYNTDGSYSVLYSSF